MRRQHELRTAARRALAYLESPPETAAERFGARLAMAFYLQLRQTEKWLRHELFFPGLHWEEERLAEIEARARRRLEEL